MSQEIITSIPDIPISGLPQKIAKENGCENGDKEDDFKTSNYVNGLIDFIEYSTAPITIALQGEWGSGKTSLMNKLRHKLCGDGRPFEGVTINTWEYSMLASPEDTVVKILRKLIASLTHPTLKEKAAKCFSALRAPVKALLGKVTYEMSNGVGLSEVVDNLFDFFSKDASDLEQLRQVLEESIARKLSFTKDDKDKSKKEPIPSKKGIIVFIDDLDRLNPPVAVEILELLKNIFTLSNCIFVLAIDYEVVVKGLEPKFGKLTDKNEREFRSFFDKIIQVPFSLPVNSYQPMTFVLDSLKKIKYIPKDDISYDYCQLQKAFTTIVESSVGKNPRSIKRLINTLSLLDCIAKHKDSDAFSKTAAAKIVNFAVVAIQVCYPKIYNMLAYQANFRKWDEDIASRMNLNIPPSEGSNEDECAVGYDEILEAVCATDIYLSQRKSDIYRLFNLIDTTLSQSDQTKNDNELDFGEKMHNIIDKSSVTGISTSIGRAEFNSAEFVKRLQSNVMERVTALRPDIKKWEYRKVFKLNGGVKFKKNSKLWRETVVKFETTHDTNLSTCNIILDLAIEKPARMRDFTIDEMLNDEKFGAMLKRLDETVVPALKNWFVRGELPENPTFISYTDLLRYLHEQDWTDGKLTKNTNFTLTFDRPSKFEQPEVINLIAELVIANYDFQISAGNL